MSYGLGSLLWTVLRTRIDLVIYNWTRHDYFFRTRLHYVLMSHLWSACLFWERHARWLRGGTLATRTTLPLLPPWNLLIICGVLLLPRPFGTCHALCGLLNRCPKGQRVNCRSLKCSWSKAKPKGGSFLWKVSKVLEPVCTIAAAGAAAAALESSLLCPTCDLATLS